MVLDIVLRLAVCRVKYCLKVNGLPFFFFTCCPIIEFLCADLISTRGYKTTSFLLLLVLLLLFLPITLLLLSFFFIQAIPRSAPGIVLETVCSAGDWTCGALSNLCGSKINNFQSNCPNPLFTLLSLGQKVPQVPNRYMMVSHGLPLPIECQNQILNLAFNDHD